MSQRRLQILVAEPSLIIRSGVVSVLLNLKNLSADIAEISDISIIAQEIHRLSPDVVILNPQYMGMMSPQKLKGESKALKFIALHISFMGGEQLRDYDAAISILESADNIEQTISNLTSNTSTESDELSEREREIVKSVAKGLSNKEIADLLCISNHTVTTHRRNIAAKLDIRNPAGLTIYAIVNGIIDISEVK